MALVSILRAAYSDLEIDSILEPLGGMERFVNRGEKVLLKVNLLSAREPERAVTTHPAVVKAVAMAVKRAGGKPYIGDSPARTFSERVLKKAYEKSGLADLAESEGIPLNYDTGVQPVNAPKGERLKQFPICSYVLEADKIISLPKLKTHSFQYMTLACKNMYGVIPGLAKAKYHARFPSRNGFADMLLDVLLTVPPCLVVMDGILAMHGQGPASGKPIQVGCMLASTDSLALDIAVCNAIGIDPIRIPVLRKAKIRRLWPEKTEYPLLKPTDVAIRTFQLPTTAGRLLTGKKQPAKLPVVTPKCIGCGDCEEICPTGAAKVDRGAAILDYALCIRCYCCHEICPENAIKLARNRGRTHADEIL